MEEKMRIAMLGHKRIPSREGGIEIVVEQLSTRMVDRGHSVTCYNRSGHHISGREYDTDNLKEYKGIKLKSVFTIDRKGLAAMTSSFCGAVCCAFSKYDVIHFHAEGPCAMLWIPMMFMMAVTFTALTMTIIKLGTALTTTGLSLGNTLQLIFAVLLLLLGVIVAVQGIKKLTEKSGTKQTA